MEKELIITIQLIFFVVVALTGVSILIFYLTFIQKTTENSKKVLTGNCFSVNIVCKSG